MVIDIPRTCVGCYAAARHGGVPSAADRHQLRLGKQKHRERNQFALLKRIVSATTANKVTEIGLVDLNRLTARNSPLDLPHQQRARDRP